MFNSSETAYEKILTLLNHELRTPITSLRGSLELLQKYRQSDSAEINHLLTLAVDSADRLNHTIEMLLNWYEVTQGTQILFRQPCSLVYIVEQAIETLQSDVSLQPMCFSLCASEHIVLSADAYLLKRAVLYLLESVIQLSRPDRQITANISLVQANHAHNRLGCLAAMINLSLPCSTIPTANLEQIFQPFYQVDRSHGQSHNGLGLELAICREIVKQHRGEVWAEYDVNQGNTFSILLPLE